MKGYIYVLTNSAMPGLVKIGRSIHGGRKRAEQLDGTGVPAPFVVSFEMIFDYVEDAECRVHNDLAKFRFSPSREFFKVSAEQAAEAVIDAWLGERDCMRISIDEAYALHQAKEKAEGTGLTNFDFIHALISFLPQEAFAFAVRKMNEHTEKCRLEAQAMRSELEA